MIKLQGYYVNAANQEVRNKSVRWSQIELYHVQSICTHTSLFKFTSSWYTMFLWPAMYLQVATLKKLRSLDINSYLVQWYQHFVDRGHICLEFEHPNDISDLSFWKRLDQLSSRYLSTCFPLCTNKQYGNICIVEIYEIIFSACSCAQPLECCRDCPHRPQVGQRHVGRSATGALQGQSDRLQTGMWGVSCKVGFLHSEQSIPVSTWNHDGS